MLGDLFKGITKIFGGNKYEKDLKDVAPIVKEVNKYFEEFKTLSNDELRSKTQEFKQKVLDFVKDIDADIAQIKLEIENIGNNDIDKKTDLFEEIDELAKRRNKKIEQILDELLPEAFAVVKTAAFRFTENKELTVSATELDKNLAVHKSNIRIEGEKAIFANEWLAAGGKIVWNMVHYDVQLIGGWSLHKGKISEMATGEGKTLVSTLPAYLNALAGEGVHLVTVNDYLARRDCEWNGPLFNFLGLRVDCLEYHQPNSEERRNAYLADITYGTNNEFGFDYLRDNMVHTPEEQVQHRHHFAMIDEVDSVLIDDARTPLIISGPTPKGDDQQFVALKPRIAKLVDEQKKLFNTLLNDAKKLIAADNTGAKEGEGGLALFRAHRALPKNKNLIKFLGETGVRGILTKTENYYLQDQQKEMPKADEPLFFTIDEKTNSVDLTERGIELITGSSEDPNFFILPDVGSAINEIERSSYSDEEKSKLKDELMVDFSVKSDRIHSVQQLLKAYTMFERDVEYIIQDGKIKIVDEQTGRILDGRRYSDGLHQAIEAKENVKVEAATQTYATITLQNYFRMYHKLAGMTGTAETEAQEFWDIYKMGVLPIPTNKPAIRKDQDDLVYKTKREKYNAIIDEVVQLSSANRPVLVGTTSVEVSELLSRMLKLRGIKHNVLNAKQHQREAEIVAEAGYPGAVTIATNMAGRGTDIKIGEVVKAAGGLAIIGTERHDSRRVDRQLRGRSGRQGDPGSSRFYVSLEDDLMRIFGAERVSKLMDRFGYKEGDVIEHSWMTKTIERNQKRMEQMHFGQRKRLLEYDDVMNKQRNNVYRMRKNALLGDRLSIDLRNMLFNWCDAQVQDHKDRDDYEGLKMSALRAIASELPFSAEEFKGSKTDILVEQLFGAVNLHYNERMNRMATQALPVFKDIYKQTNGQAETIMVPVSNGTYIYELPVDTNKVISSDGAALRTEIEKFFVLLVLDDEWKEHLRELDDLKESVRNAAYEQKDPLLIYKIESFELFGQMLNRMNDRILGMLFRAEITAREVHEGQKPQKKETQKLQTGREDIMAEMSSPAGGGASGHPEMEAETVPQMPIRNEMKVGRNDPCPCGSGKKYKQCHGKE